MKKVMSLYRVT